jgi:hypothetical protein
MGVARVRISHEFLAKAMGFPDGTKLRGVTTSNDTNAGLILEHEEIKGDYENLPLIHPKYTRVQFEWVQSE